MSIFKPITLAFREKSYTIPADRIMPCLAMVEDVVTLEQLSSKRPPLVKLSQAYGLALRYAGANVTDEEVYETVFMKTGANVITSAVAGLLQMMIPPARLQAAVVDESAKKPQPGKRPVKKVAKRTS